MKSHASFNFNRKAPGKERCQHQDPDSKAYCAALIIKYDYDCTRTHLMQRAVHRMGTCQNGHETHRTHNPDAGPRPWHTVPKTKNLERRERRNLRQQATQAKKRDDRVVIKQTLNPQEEKPA